MLSLKSTHKLLFNTSKNLHLTHTQSPITKRTPNHLSFTSLTSNSRLIINNNMSQSQTIEHIVLFKVKDSTDPSKVNAMVNSLNGLISLDSVLHLTSTALHRTKSSPVPFTHILHSRYPSKEALAAYSAHPDHLSVVRSSVLPISDDIMAVDWVTESQFGSVAPGSAVRVSFLKLKEGVGEEARNEVLEVIKGVKDKFRVIDQLSFGENFSPARAKGFSIASVAVFPSLKELDEVDSNVEAVKFDKDKVKDYLDGVIVLDFVVPTPASL